MSIQEEINFYLARIKKYQNMILDCQYPSYVADLLEKIAHDEKRIERLKNTIK